MFVTQQDYLLLNISATNEGKAQTMQVKQKENADYTKIRTRT